MTNMKRFVFIVLLAFAATAASAQTFTNVVAKLSGAQLKAYSVGLEAFLNTPDAHNLEHYIIHLAKEDDSYDVVFQPETTPEDGLGGYTKYGREIHYIVSKKDYKVLRMHYAK